MCIYCVNEKLLLSVDEFKEERGVLKKQNYDDVELVVKDNNK